MPYLHNLGQSGWPFAVLWNDLEQVTNKSILGKLLHFYSERKATAYLTNSLFPFPFLKTYNSMHPMTTNTICADPEVLESSRRHYLYQTRARAVEANPRYMERPKAPLSPSGSSLSGASVPPVSPSSLIVRWIHSAEQPVTK